jgi:hypothetical protein
VQASTRLLVWGTDGWREIHHLGFKGNRSSLHCTRDTYSPIYGKNISEPESEGRGRGRVDAGADQFDGASRAPSDQGPRTGTGWGEADSRNRRIAQVDLEGLRRVVCAVVHDREDDVQLAPPIPTCSPREGERVGGCREGGCCRDGRNHRHRPGGSANERSTARASAAAGDRLGCPCLVVHGAPPERWCDGAYLSSIRSIHVRVARSTRVGCRSANLTQGVRR